MDLIILHTVCAILAFVGLFFLASSAVNRHRVISNIGYSIEIINCEQLENLDLALDFIRSMPDYSQRRKIILLMNSDMLLKMTSDGTLKCLISFYNIEYYLIEKSRTAKQNVE